MRCLQDTARVVLALWLALAPAHAGSLTLLGAGKVAGPTYQGPGDVVSFNIWGSCSRAYSSATPAGTNMCDLVDSAAPTTVICTLKTLATGLVDLASASCTGSVAPATKCAAATGGACNISKVYNQVSPGTNDLTQATSANQPTLTFGAVNSLPGMTFNAGSGLVQSGTISQSQPFSFSGVFMRTNGLSAGGMIGADAGATVCVGGNTANNAYITAGTAQNAAATDNVFHALSGLLNGASSAINVDASDTAGVNAGAGAFAGNAVRIGRCNGATMTGIIMEAGMINASTTPTQRNNLSANQHGTNGYNF